jgi:hypothetical protein
MSEFVFSDAETPAQIGSFVLSPPFRGGCFSQLGFEPVTVSALCR